MIEIVKRIAAVVATCSEFTAVIVIAVGALEALGSMAKTLIRWETAVLPLLVFRGFAGRTFLNYSLSHDLRKAPEITGT